MRSVADKRSIALEYLLAEKPDHELEHQAKIPCIESGVEYRSRTRDGVCIRFLE